MESYSKEDPLENALEFEPFEDKKGNQGLALMEANLRSNIQPLRVGSLRITQPKLSIEESPKLELKAHLSHLKYVYLGNSSTFPVIVSIDLTEYQDEQLIVVLKKFKKEIGWKIADIRRYKSFLLYA
ncbi:Integrase core domain containing protein [Gossypium australe]|uniref:Integrase core domain containing protein n=1 Tax=Gossypium australe TaxID=47621 RepID=A0A5B6WF10_9ROSI|nr:Integrase core domain containing protein [Gossypium australe]